MSLDGHHGDGILDDDQHASGSFFTMFLHLLLVVVEHFLLLIDAFQFFFKLTVSLCR